MAVQETHTISGMGIEDFTEGLRGRVIRAGDPDYDDARTVRNGLIDRRPAVIVRCSGTSDVVDAVNFARDQGLTLSVRGGGHNVAGNAVNDDGLVIDLSGMRAVFVSPAKHTVRAQGGATWGDVDRETQRYGMSVPGGVVSTTGIGGLTLHGGLGHMRRKHGLSIDNLLSVEIVTADGQVRTADAEENTDLFWAVRGAGPNFGVVTSFEYRMHPIGPSVYLSAVMYPMNESERVVRGWRAIMEEAPDEVNSVLLLWSVPDVDAFPPEVRKQPVAIVAAVYVGPVDEGEQATLPLRQLGTPLLDLSHVDAFTAVQAAFDPFFPVGRLYYWKSTYLDDLSDIAIDTMARSARSRPSYMSGITFWHLGGAIGRVDPEATAYARRDAPYLFTAEATWTDPAENDANIRWSRDSLAAMQPFSKGGMYLNFPGFGEEKETMLRATYGPNYDRLVEVKTCYDPGNLFHMNQNIRPIKHE